MFSQKVKTSIFLAVYAGDRMVIILSELKNFTMKSEKEKMMSGNPCKVVREISEEE